MPGQVAPITDERALLLAYIAQQRDGIRYAAYGLTDEQARMTPTQSSLSVGGLVKHVTAMERSWVDTMLQRPPQDVEQGEADYEAGFRLGPDESLAAALADYDQAARETDEAVAGVEMDAGVPGPQGGPGFTG